MSALLGVPVAGFLITRGGGFPAGYRLSFSLALLFLFTSMWLYARIPEPREVNITSTSQAKPKKEGRWWRTAFASFALARFVWTITASVAGPFYVVFMSKQLHLDASAIGLLTSVAMAMQLVGYGLLGGMIDKQGSRWTLCTTVFVIAPVPLAWLLVHVWWHIVPIQIVAGLIGATHELAVFSLLLELTPEEERPIYFSVYYTLNGLAATLGSLIGAWLFDNWAFSVTMLAAGCGGLVAALSYILALRPKPGRFSTLNCL